MLFVKRDSANCVIFILSLEKRKNCSAILVSANLGHFVYIYMVFMCVFFRSKMEPTESHALEVSQGTVLIF